MLHCTCVHKTVNFYLTFWTSCGNSKSALSGGSDLKRSYCDFDLTSFESFSKFPDAPPLSPNPVFHPPFWPNCSAVRDASQWSAFLSHDNDFTHGSEHRTRQEAGRQTKTRLCTSAHADTQVQWLHSRGILRTGQSQPQLWKWTSKPRRGERRTGFPLSFYSRKAAFAFWFHLLTLFLLLIKTSAGFQSLLVYPCLCQRCQYNQQNVEQLWPAFLS